MRSAQDLDLPGGKADAPAARERDMAMRLVDDMTVPWDPAAYRDDYREDLLKAIGKKVKAGKTHELSEPDAKRPRESAKVIDLMALLKQSVEERGAARKPPARQRPAAKKTSARKSAAPAKRKAA
ncbi:Non-homologous end joining protein Ku [compost metagenome]